MVHLMNVRAGGFASNSSSSHSCWLFDRTPKFGERWDHTAEFGWDNFTLVTENAKMTYLATALYGSMHALSPELRHVILKGLGLPVVDTDSYIDHQSLMSIPSDWLTKGLPDVEFIHELSRWFADRRLAVLGGSDNNNPHPIVKAIEDHKYDHLEPRKVRLFKALNGAGEDLVARRDSSGFWTLFNRQTGNKIRFTFDDITDMSKAPTRADTPELVDLSITDYCPFGCEYCYKGSGSSGNHAKTTHILSIIDALAEMKVFEVAFGGGEPTLHPDFWSIIKHTRNNGIVPNFTTRRSDWLNVPEYVNAVINSGCGVAFSVERCDEVVKKVGAALAAGINYNNINVHLVMGTMYRDEFTRLLRTIDTLGVHAVLLGYKETGRGKTHRKIEYPWWVEVARESKMSVNIDTALAQEYHDRLIQEDIPEWMYHTQEGRWSMYIDAVSLKMGASSYDGEMIPLTNSDGDWLSIGDVSACIKLEFVRF